MDQQLVDWLEDELEMKRDLIDSIESGSVRFWTRDIKGGEYETTEKDLVLARQKAAEIEDFLAELRGKRAGTLG